MSVFGLKNMDLDFSKEFLPTTEVAEGRKGGDLNVQVSGEHSTRF